MMKNKYFIFLICFCISVLSFSQIKKAIYIEIEKDFKMTISKDGMTVLQAYLYVKKNDRFDSYYFNINTEFKEFDKSAVLLESKNFTILKEIDYKKLSPCELHEFFSDNRNIYLVYKKEGKFYGWILFYEGTSKNIIITKQTGKI